MHDVPAREVKKIPTLRGRTVINLFFEDSTRTRSSFEIAGKWMSADTINITGKGSSTSKGESLRDTVLTICAMASMPWSSGTASSGACHQVAGWVDASGHQRRRRHARAPLAGPAGRLHVAPALGSLEGRHVVIVGDLAHSRVFRSNVITLGALGARVTVVAPPTLMPSGISDWSAADGFATIVGSRRNPQPQAKTLPTR
jgi:aspartate carbamoyltransferase catalytic subunit